MAEYHYCGLVLEWSWGVVHGWSLSDLLLFRSFASVGLGLHGVFQCLQDMDGLSEVCAGWGVFTWLLLSMTWGAAPNMGDSAS